MMGFKLIVMADRTLLSQLLSLRRLRTRSMLESAFPKLESRGSPPLLPFNALGVLS